jgi:hypothetical protein
MLTLVILCLSLGTTGYRRTLNATLMDHAVVVDENNKIVPWTTGEQPFDSLVVLAWDWWRSDAIPKENGYPLYYFYGSYTPSTRLGKEWSVVICRAGTGPLLR